MSEDECDDDEEYEILLTCRTSPRAKSEFHVHGEAQNLVWNLGNEALKEVTEGAWSLNGPAKLLWREFDKNSMQKVLQEAELSLKIKVPGGKMPEKF